MLNLLSCVSPFIMTCGQRESAECGWSNHSRRTFDGTTAEIGRALTPGATDDVSHHQRPRFGQLHDHMGSSLLGLRHQCHQFPGNSNGFGSASVTIRRAEVFSVRPRSIQIGKNATGDYHDNSLIWHKTQFFLLRFDLGPGGAEEAGTSCFKRLADFGFKHSSINVRRHWESSMRGHRCFTRLITPALRG